MAMEDSYWKPYNAYRNRDNYKEVFPMTLSKLSSEVNLTSVKSCVTFGPGDGEYDVQLIKQCAANTSKIIAVEPDHQSAERLRARLEKSLPGVDNHVIEATIQSWKGLDDPVDLAVMMHVLYYFRPGERKKLFKKLHEQWLAQGGRVIVVSASRTNCPGSGYMVFERVGKPLTAWEDIEADLLEAGFIKQHAHEIQYKRDFSNLDEHILRFYQHHAPQPITLDDVRSAIEKLFPHGKSAEVFYTCAVFQKA